MQITKQVSVLQKAYAAGFASFYTYDNTKDETGHPKGWPPNPYMPNSLPYKEFERGFNAAYTANRETTR